MSYFWLSTNNISKVQCQMVVILNNRCITKLIDFINQKDSQVSYFLKLNSQWIPENRGFINQDALIIIRNLWNLIKKLKYSMSYKNKNNMHKKEVKISKII